VATGNGAGFHRGEAMRDGTSAKARMQDFELHIVQQCSRLAGNGLGRIVAIAVSKLGNGWLYPVLAVGFLAAAGLGAWPVVLAAGIGIAVGQGLLALLKRRHRRTRPYVVDLELKSLIPVQDPNSFPSGHMMTLTAAVVPALMAFPTVAWFAGPLWLLMAWSRMACAHHYPSDVLAGTALGFAIAYPISAGFSGASLL
jgi:undecaprenyl-diphosphatase